MNRDCGTKEIEEEEKNRYAKGKEEGRKKENRHAVKHKTTNRFH